MTTVRGSGLSDTVTLTGQSARRAAGVAPVNTPNDAILEWAGWPLAPDASDLPDRADR